VLTDFIGEGHFGRHIRRMRTLCRERQTIRVEALRREAGGVVEVEPLPAGIHLVAWLPDGLDDGEVARRAAARGVEARPMSAFYAGSPGRGGLELGYAAYNEEKLRRGAARLAEAVRACASARRTNTRRRAV